MSFDKINLLAGRKINVVREYKVDRILANEPESKPKNIKVLRLPTKMCELNPIGGYHFEIFKISSYCKM